MTGARGVRLTERQHQVLALIAEGWTEQEIATKLGISPRTVRMHADALRFKLGVQRRRQLPFAYRRTLSDETSAARFTGSERASVEET